MTITVAPARNELTANAGQTIFNYTFKIFSITDLNVYITPTGQNANDSTDLTTAYTVLGVGDEDGGTITLTVGATLNDLITIVSNTPSSRTTDYQNNGDFRPDTVNADFDRVVSLVKKIEDSTNRSLLSPQSKQGPKPLSLPEPVIGELLRWNDTLSGLENISLNELPVGTFPVDRLALNYSTLAAWQADTSAQLKDVVTTKERTAGFGGGGTGDVIASGTESGFNIVKHNTLPLSWELRESSLSILTTRHYGAVSGDITALLQQFALSTHKNKIISEGSYSITSDVNFLQGEDSIHFEGEPTITADGTYTQGVINFGSTVRTLLATTVSTLTKGVRALPVTGVTKDDLLAVWNPVDASYLGGPKPDYRQGEFALATDDSGATTPIDSALIDTYPTGTKIFNLTTNQTPKKISGKVNFTSAAYATRTCININQAKLVDITGLQVFQEESTHTLSLNRCFRVSGIDVAAKQTASTTSGLDYGILAVNCQYVDVDGYFHAERHGATTGVVGGDATIVNRFVNITGVITTTGQGGVAAAEWHGNTESCSYGGQMTSVIFAGHNNRVLPYSIIDPVPGADTPSVLGIELKSMQHSIGKGTIITNYNDPFNNSQGVVDIGGISVGQNEFTVLPGKFDLSGVKIVAPIARVAILNRNRGSLVDYDIDVSDVELDCPLAATSAIRILKVTGNTMRRLYMAKFFDPDKNPIVLDTAIKIDNLEESGVESILTNTGVSFVTVAVVFNKKFPFIPSVRTQYEGGLLGTKLPQAVPESVTATGFNLTIRTYDNSNFSAGVTRDCFWEASINK